MKQWLSDLLDSSIYWLPPLIGGVVDYANQLLTGKKRWSCVGMTVHLSSAVFFGWMIGMAVHGLEYNTHLVAASGGLGGFLGTRVADLAIKLIQRGKPDKPGK